MNFETLQEEYDRIKGIAYEVRNILALAAYVEGQVMAKPLDKEESRGLIAILDNYRGLIEGALPPQGSEE
jgi:hypothetical protein